MNMYEMKENVMKKMSWLLRFIPGRRHRFVAPGMPLVKLVL